MGQVGDQNETNVHVQDVVFTEVRVNEFAFAVELPQDQAQVPMGFTRFWMIKCGILQSESRLTVLSNEIHNKNVKFLLDGLRCQNP